MRVTSEVTVTVTDNSSDSSRYSRISFLFVVRRTGKEPKTVEPTKRHTTPEQPSVVTEQPTDIPQQATNTTEQSPDITEESTNNTEAPTESPKQQNSTTEPTILFNIS